MLRLEPPDRGVLFLVSGPSGVGKSTLVRHALDRIPGVGFSVSATTRAPRAGERDGVHYHFLSPETFAQRVAEGDFLEHATVYERSYGTLRAPVERALADGRSILLDIDVQGVAQVQPKMPDAVSIFVLPPDRPTLRARLEGRAEDSAEVIEGRMAQADLQLAGIGRYDHLVLNDHLDTAKEVFVGVMLAALTQRRCRSSWVDRWAVAP